MTDRRPSFLAWVLVGGSAFLVFLVALFAAVFLAARDGQPSFSFSGNRIGLVKVEGEIFTSSAVIADLERFGKDSSIKAIVIRLNSPGGAVSPSQEIYSAVKRVRAEYKKPVWASIGIVGASGAYYIACGADRIYANPGSITGSIGVIAEWYSYGELLKWAKMKDVVVKAGKLKDAGNPARDMNEDERAYMQAMVDEMHEQFIAAVAEGRKMKAAQVRPFADGRVFTGQKAQKMGMIDGVADLQQVIQDVARAAGIRGEPSVVSPPGERRSLLETLLDSVTSVLPPAARESLGAPYTGRIKFQYLWR